MICHRNPLIADETERTAKDKDGQGRGQASQPSQKQPRAPKVFRNTGIRLSRDARALLPEVEDLETELPYVHI